MTFGEFNPLSAGMLALLALDNDKQVQRRPIVRLQRKYKANRNDPCPCQSGKKFKRCCINATERVPILTG